MGMTCGHASCVQCRGPHHKEANMTSRQHETGQLPTKHLSGKAHGMCHIFSSVLLRLVSGQALHDHSSVPVDVLYDAVLDLATVQPLPWILQCS